VDLKGRGEIEDLEDLITFVIIHYIDVHIFISLDYSQDAQNNLLLLYMQNGRASSKVLLSFIRNIIRSFHFISTSSSTAMVSFDHPVVRLLGSRSSSSSSLISASTS
jgi:hypothetical protein